MKKKMEKVSDKEMKEKILDNLSEETKLRCSRCKSDVFLRRGVEKDCRVYMIDDGEGIRDEDIDMCVTDYTYKCANCGKDITEEELI